MRIVLLSLTVFLILFFPLLTHQQLVRIPFQKLNKNPSTPNLNILNLRASDDTSRIKNYQSIEYIGTIRVGSHKKEFKVLLDTGSAPFWIPDSSLTDAAHSFDCSQSETCSSQRTNIQTVPYRVGSVTGFEAKDQLQIGGVTVEQQKMLLVTKIEKLQNAHYDGILGLSLGRGTQLKQFPTLLENMKSSGAIKTGTFSMYLGNDQNAKGEPMGEIIFGGYDQKYAASEFKFIKVASPELTLLWQGDMSVLGFGLEKNVSDIGKFPVSFDSGSSMSIFPESFIKKIVEEAGEKGVKFTFDSTLNLYRCDCEAKKKLPNLYFYFEEAVFDIPASSYIFSNEYCYLGLASLKGEIGFSNPAVLGDVFLNDHYALYTLDNSTVGLAKARPFRRDPRMFSWLIISTLVFIGLLGLIIYCFINRRKNEIEEPSYGRMSDSSLGKAVEEKL